MSPLRGTARGRASQVLVLCRACVQYVRPGTVVCPHCGGDPRAASARYSEGGFALTEAMRRIEELRARLASNDRKAVGRPEQ